jgi:hypothetical protein
MGKKPTVEESFVFLERNGGCGLKFILLKPAICSITNN